MEKAAKQNNDLGIKHDKNGDYSRAEQCFNESIDILSKCQGPRVISNLNETLYNLGVAQLKHGNYRDGFNNYRAFLNLDRTTNRPFYNTHGFPVIQKNTRAVLIYFETGIGDFIMFCRFIPRFVEKYKYLRVFIEVTPGLLPLVSRIPFLKPYFIITKNVNIPIEQSHPSVDIDHHVEITTLPHYVNIKNPIDTDIHMLPFITSTITKPHPEKKICATVNWMGRPTSDKYYHRRIDASFIELMCKEIPEIYWLSIQKMSRFSKEPLTQIKNLNYDINLDNQEPFEDTVAYIKMSDFTITSDTSIAHIAGSMNQPTLLILGDGHEWRWHNAKNWYPTVTVFKPGSNVIEFIRNTFLR